MPNTPKIATRLVDATTGEVYVIGTTGSHEHVRVELSAPEAVDWTQYQVQVQDLTAETSQTLDLTAGGVCEFDIPMGDMYEVNLPVVGQYVQPNVISATAAQASRTITHMYTTDSRVETLVISSHVFSLDGGTVALLNGLPVIATDTLGNNFVAYFNALGKCSLEIPYGRVYNVVFPSLGGYSHNHNGEHHTAGLPSREIDVHYTQIGMGIFGMDAQGNMYTTAQIAELADKSIIVAGGFNDVTLNESSRGDGTFGNGFLWKIGNEKIGDYAWADANVRFDTNRLPFYSNLGELKYAGKHLTDMIIEIGEDGGASDGAVHATPAASQCAAKTLTIAGVDRQGFLPAYDQIYAIATLNRTAFQDFYTALGRTAPTLWSGRWWTSCQRNDSNAVRLYNGGFDDNYKTDSHQVFCCYDL